jgi:hypothetical protein
MRAQNDIIVCGAQDDGSGEVYAALPGYLPLMTRRYFAVYDQVLRFLPRRINAHGTSPVSSAARPYSPAKA